MTNRYAFVLLAIAFALLPVVLPARQSPGGDSPIIIHKISPEAALVLDLVRDLDQP